MKKIMPSFKDDTDRVIIVGVIVSSIFFSFIPSLIGVLLGKNYMSESSNAIAKAIFNFELLLFLVALTFMIPIVGWLLGVILAPLMVIFNVVIMVINLCSIAKGGETKIPVPYEFL